MQTILLVEDDQRSCYAMGAGLESVGYRVLTAETAAMALSLVAENPDLLLADIRLAPGEIDGITLSSMLRVRRPKLPVLYVTAFEELGHQARDHGPVLIKPVELDALVAGVRAELANSK